MSEIGELGLIDPSCYSQRGYPHDAWTALRRDPLLRYVEPPGWRGFWAIVKHADIVEISKQPRSFLNGPGMVMFRETGRQREQEQQIKTVSRIRESGCSRSKLG